jgi:CDP-glycerol glycerophosphotransferase
MLGSGVVADITPLLPGFDVLVTDYSSLAFDAALAELPTVFFAPDLEAYTASRGSTARTRRSPATIPLGTGRA